MYIIKEKSDGTFEVRKKGAQRASKICNSKAEAIAYCESKGYTYDVEVKLGNKNVSINSKTVKSHKKIIIPVIILLLLILGGFFTLGYLGYIDLSFLHIKRDEHKPNQSVIGEKYDEFQIHFLELGNKYTGDSIYIKAGDTDILIDAGSRQSSATTIKEYLDGYVTDNKLEYVIATHGDQDHIAGFIGNKSGSNYTGILYQYEVDNIIMNSLTSKTSQTYENFLEAVAYNEDKGTNVMYAGDCFEEKNGAKRTYILDAEQNITMDILYNYYYFNSSSDENNYSVCTMFNYNGHHFMLTGDLEKEGEEEMAKYYDGSSDAKTLPHVDLFKAGHHGSKTSSNDCLLELITPDIVCVCCCAGGSEYTANYQNVFPTQDFINRVAKYTDQVYVTSYFDEKSLEMRPLNGNIIVSTNGSSVAVAASNNTTKLKDTAWFNEEVYVNSSDNICSGKGEEDFFTENSPGVKKVPRRTWPSYGVSS